MIWQEAEIVKGRTDNPLSLEQAKMVLGSKARIEKDPNSGMRSERVMILIGHHEFSGFVSTEPDSDRIYGVHLLGSDGRPFKQIMFARLNRRLIDEYEAPSIESPASLAGKICMWPLSS